jgi:hypothetical protein
MRAAATKRKQEGFSSFLKGIKSNGHEKKIKEQDPY